MKFVGDCGSADLRAAFEHERLESCLGQIECGDQPVMASADNDDIPLTVAVCAAMARPLP